MIQRAPRSHVSASALIAASLLGAGLLNSQSALAQDDNEPFVVEDMEKPEEPAPAEEPAEEAPAADAEAQAAAQAEADSQVGVKLAATGDANAAAQVDAEGDAKGTPAPPPPPYGTADEWHITPYGYVRFDAIRDSTQSFYDGMSPYLIARPGTYKGMHPRMTMTARDSRLGLSIGAPEFAGIRTSGRIEFDFFGIPPTDVRENDQITFGPVRIRHAFVNLENSVVDVLAGQTWDVFGWGPTFFPATVAFLGVPGQVYHRNPQFRLQKTLDLGGLTIDIAAAAVRPGQRDSGVPDVQGGVKFAIDGWTGAATPGFGRAEIRPLSIGLSGLYRQFEMPVFRSEPGFESTSDTGYGLVANIVLPVIPADKPDDKANALTLTGEFSTGSGISEMYTGMDGGSRLPLLPNTRPVTPAYIYPQNIDTGLATFDRSLSLTSINWQAFVAGLQYYLPIGGGDVWVSGVYSQIESDNIKEVTPTASRGAVFTKMEYMDASVGVAITPAVSLGLSFQTLKQTFGDVSPPTPVWGATADYFNGVELPTQAGTGGEAATARNNRAQVTMKFDF